MIKYLYSGLTTVFILSELFLYYLHFVEVGKFGVPFSIIARNWAYWLFAFYLMGLAIATIVFMVDYYDEKENRNSRRR